MKCLALDNYHDFECVGAACPATCCAGWAVLVDADSVAFYESVPGEFGDKSRRNLFTETTSVISRWITNAVRF